MMQYTSAMHREVVTCATFSIMFFVFDFLCVVVSVFLSIVMNYLNWNPHRKSNAETSRMGATKTHF